MHGSTFEAYNTAFGSELTCGFEPEQRIWAVAPCSDLSLSPSLTFLCLELESADSGIDQKTKHKENAFSGPNGRDRRGRTALHFTSGMALPECTALLLEAGKFAILDFDSAHTA